MENQVIVIQGTKEDIKTGLKEFLSEKKEKEPVDFKSEKLSITKAAKFADMSVPTFNRRVRNGLFKKHGSGRKIFFIKSEIISALRESIL